MNHRVVIQGESGEVGICHQFPCPAGNLEALRHVGEVVRAGIELNEMRMLEPALHNSNRLNARHRRRYYDRTGRQPDKPDRYGKRYTHSLSAGQ